jgi:hypothetical protein
MFRKSAFPYPQNTYMCKILGNLFC